MNVFRIRTTDWEENDFLIMTSLNEKQVRRAIEPIIEYEKENDLASNPDDYVSALNAMYNKAVVVPQDNFETLKF
jgi:hypothetical protein